MAAKIKGKQVSATISPELFDALDEFKWSQKKTLTQLIRTAVEEYADRHNITVAEANDDDTSPEDSAEAPAPDAT